MPEPASSPTVTGPGSSSRFFLGKPPAVVDAAAEAMFRSPEDDTSRDVLPLPSGPALNELLRGPRPNACSQSQSRRGRRQRAEERWLRDGISALNFMGGAGRQANELRTPILARRTAIRRFARLYGEVGEPDESWDTLNAWSALQGTRPGYSDDVVAAGTSVTYRRGAASLPQLGGGISRCPNTARNRSPNVASIKKNKLKNAPGVAYGSLTLAKFVWPGLKRQRYRESK